MGRSTASVVIILLTITLCVLPTAVFLSTLHWSALLKECDNAFGPGGLPSIVRTFKLALTTAAIGGVFGWLTGLWLMLSRSRVRITGSVLLSLPLVCPPFLWAVGVQSWKRFLPFQYQVWLDGFSGHVIASSLVTGPIVALLCARGSVVCTQSAAESALLHGGKAKLITVLLRGSLPGALAGSLLAGLLVAAEVGTGQMMGWQSGAGVIHAALVTGQNFEQAAARAVMMLCLVVPAVVIAAWPLSCRMIYRSPASRGHGAASFEGVSILVLAALPLTCGCGAMLTSIFSSAIAPLWQDALQTWSESIFATGEMILISAAFTAAVASLLGALLVKHPCLWRCTLVVGLVLLAIPQSIHGLGWILLRTQHLHLTAFVGEPAIVVSLRWVLLAAHFVALAWSRMQTTALDAAFVFCQSPLRRWWVITKPIIFSSVLPVAAIAALLVTGDAAATVLLQPPGWATYSARLFGIMDNAPEGRVAMLCLIYIAGVALVIIAGVAMLRSIGRQTSS